MPLLRLLLLVFLDALLSIPIIHSALVLILKHLVGFIHISILLSILLISAMLVGMQLSG